MFLWDIILYQKYLSTYFLESEYKWYLIAPSEYFVCLSNFCQNTFFYMMNDSQDIQYIVLLIAAFYVQALYYTSIIQIVL